MSAASNLQVLAVSRQLYLFSKEQAEKIDQQELSIN